MFMGACVMVQGEWSGKNLWTLVFSSPLWRDQIQVIRLGGNHLCLLSQLDSSDGLKS